MLALDQLESAELADQSVRDGLVERVDLYRATAVRKLDPARRVELGQFPTPPAVARFMASLFNKSHDTMRLLDAGAGVGTLTAAFVEDACHRTIKPKRIEATAYELDPSSVTVLSILFVVIGWQKSAPTLACPPMALTTQIKSIDAIVRPAS